MYFAMNRFRIAAGREAEFEKVWRERTSLLADVPGFLRFHLLRGATEEGATLYVSHSEWASEKAFLAWTESDAFTKAHRSGRSPEGVVLGPPRFEGFSAVLDR